MNKSEKKIAQAAERFAKRWLGRGYEKGESQLFWTELLTKVFGTNESSIAAHLAHSTTGTKPIVIFSSLLSIIY